MNILKRLASFLATKVGSIIIVPPNLVISCGPRLPLRLRLTYGPVRVVPRVRHRRRSERHRLRLAVGVGAVAVRGVLEESHDVVCRQPEHGIVAAKKKH